MEDKLERLKELVAQLHTAGHQLRLARTITKIRLQEYKTIVEQLVQTQEEISAYLNHQCGLVSIPDPDELSTFTKSEVAQLVNDPNCPEVIITAVAKDLAFNDWIKH